MTSKEEWRDVVGYEGAYQVSSLGQVRGLARTVVTKAGVAMRLPAKALKANLDRDGYAMVTLWRNGRPTTVKVHRLVAAHFINPDIKGFPINHLDFDRANNSAENLEVVTTRDNCLHSNLAGHGSGMTNPRMRRKVTPEIAAEIRAAVNIKGGPPAVGRKYGISRALSYDIAAGIAWRMPGEPVPAATSREATFNPRCAFKLTPEKVEAMHRLHGEGVRHPPSPCRRTSRGGLCRTGAVSVCRKWPDTLPPSGRGH